jgi:hypothetical protein
LLLSKGQFLHESHFLMPADDTSPFRGWHLTPSRLEIYTFQNEVS